jgi:ribonuclease BN (tRNA processing enzyme)
MRYEKSQNILSNANGPLEISPAALDDINLCYLLQMPANPGKFDAAKAKALGVDPGPSFGLLVKGESIVTKDGRTVHPADVISPQIPGEVCGNEADVSFFMLCGGVFLYF